MKAAPAGVLRHSVQPPILFLTGAAGRRAAANRRGAPRRRAGMGPRGSCHLRLMDP
ncbi:hypothetical protein JCM13210_00280 [Thermaerobacter litoralis]